MIAIAAHLAFAAAGMLAGWAIVRTVRAHWRRVCDLFDTQHKEW